jgi:hypothetical protein
VQAGQLIKILAQRHAKFTIQHVAPHDNIGRLPAERPGRLHCDW